MQTCSKVKQQSLALLLFILLSVSGCSTKAPFTEPEDPESLQGPGIFSGEKGYFKLDNSKPGSDAQNTGKPDASADCDAYLQWKKASTEGKNSAQYQAFLQWIEYQHSNSNIPR